MLYQLNFFVDSNQGLALFRQNQIFRSTGHNYLQKQNNEDFFIRLLNARLQFTNDNYPALTSVKQTLERPIFFNP